MSTQCTVPLSRPLSPSCRSPASRPLSPSCRSSPASISPASSAHSSPRLRHSSPRTTRSPTSISPSARRTERASPRPSPLATRPTRSPSPTLRPLSRSPSPGPHSSCSDCSICEELAAGDDAACLIYLSNGNSGSNREVRKAIKTEKLDFEQGKKSSGVAAAIAQVLLSPILGRKVKKEVVRDRSIVQSPLMRRSEKLVNGGEKKVESDVDVVGCPANGTVDGHEYEATTGLPGGDSGETSSTIPSPKNKKSKWSTRLKLKTPSGSSAGEEKDKISETSSFSSHESERSGKRKKTERKRTHSRGSSFDYRLFKDMFKISLPRSVSAGDLGKKGGEEGILEEEGEVERKGKKGGLKSSLSWRGKNGSKVNCSDLPDGDLLPPQGNGLVGLKNLGNTCFMNSILQCLSHTCPVRDFFLSREYKGMLCSSSKMQGRLAEEFASLIADMWSGRHDTVSPNKFKSAVAKSAPRFVGYSQQDSQEFLRFFMEGLHEDLNMGIKGKRRMEEPPKGLTDSQLADHRWNGYVAYDNSSIVDIFVGLLKSTLTCSVCDHKSVTFDPFWDLSLPLPRAKSSGLNLQTCFAEFTQEEVLDGDEKPTCENCKKRQKCTKQFSIERFPQLLVLHLKRFSEVRYRTKLSTRVEFPIDNLDLSDVSSDSHLQVPQYDLVGVSNHSGNTFSGHYIAYCRTGSSRWHRFSDSSVGQLSRSDIVSSEAYVLFYERKSSQS